MQRCKQTVHEQAAFAKQPFALASPAALTPWQGCKTPNGLSCMEVAGTGVACKPRKLSRDLCSTCPSKGEPLQTSWAPPLLPSMKVWRPSRGRYLDGFGGLLSHWQFHPH